MWRPGEDLLAGSAVDNGDTVLVGEIDENAICVGINLKPFGVSFQLYSANLAPRCRVDYREGASAIADDDPARFGVDANIVGVRAERDCFCGGEVHAVEYVH